MISLPSFNSEWREKQSVKPRIMMLEVSNRDHEDGEPLGWIVLEREETYRRDPYDESLYDATIRLSYQRLAGSLSHQEGRKYFDGSYSALTNAVSLTSRSMAKGAVFLDLPGLEGHRIGTYLMNEIVRWAQQWPEANVNSIELVEGQAHGDNKARRNRFYEQFGLVFDYTDVEHREGRSRVMRAGELIQTEAWKQNLVEHTMIDYLVAKILAEERITWDLHSRDKACAELIAERKKAEAHPLRWAVGRLYSRYRDIALFGVILALIVGAVWFRVMS
ncbi:hypothetical protein ACT3OH_12860 [Vreelandella zhanjiangensis]|uniref:hypothetical protein n=1 Tax=Vreelandella zhanjiangensis TaxID=1121960 RepID=UPI00402ADD2D